MKRLRSVLVVALALTAAAVGGYLNRLHPAGAAVYQGLGGSADANTTRQLYIQKGLALSGISSDYGVWFYDFDGRLVDGGGRLGDLKSVVGGGAAAPTFAAVKGGVTLEDTSAVAGGQTQMFTEASAVADMSTDAWYFAVRARAVDTPTANTREVWGLADFLNTKSILIGSLGPLNGTNFVVQYNGNFGGSSTSLGVAFDTAFHVFEMWHSAGSTTVSGRMDGGTIVTTGALSAMAVDGRVWGEVYNGGTANRFRRHTDWVMYLYPR